MWNTVKYFVILMVSLGLYFGPIVTKADTKVLPTVTKTRTVTPSRTVTLSMTSTATASQTASATSSPTATETVTPSVTSTPIPTATLVPTATPIQKIEILLFEKQRIWPGQVLTSNIIDVSQYKEATLFLSSGFETGSYPGNYGNCYFLTNNGSGTERYKGGELSITTRNDTQNTEQRVVNGKIIGPKLICEVVNGSTWATVKSFYLYLIP